MAKQRELPDCDELFLRFFDRWYSDDARGRRPFKATRPDAEGLSAAGMHSIEFTALTEVGRDRVANQVSTMVHAAEADWPKYLAVTGEPSVAWVDEFDRYYTHPRVLKTIEQSDPADFGNDLVVICCEFGAVLGHVMLSRLEGAEWLYEWPYWESAVYDWKHGYRINVFHWAIKKFSSYGIDDGYAAKLLATVDLATAGWPRDGA